MTEASDPISGQDVEILDPDGVVVAYGHAVAATDHQVMVSFAGQPAYCICRPSNRVVPYARRLVRPVVPPS